MHAPGLDQTISGGLGRTAAAVPASRLKVQGAVCAIEGMRCN
jgi:hypothetical protein